MVNSAIARVPGCRYEQGLMCVLGLQRFSGSLFIGSGSGYTDLGFSDRVKKNASRRACGFIFTGVMHSTKAVTPTLFGSNQFVISLAIHKPCETLGTLIKRSMLSRLSNIKTSSGIETRPRAIQAPNETRLFLL